MTNVSEPVGIPNSGSATTLHIGADVPAAPGTVQAITIGFGQVVPKPFCAAPGELVRVDGPLSVEQRVTIDGSGALYSEMTAGGELTVRSVTATGLGDPIVARIREHNRTGYGDGVDVVSGNHQLLIADSGATQQLQEKLRVGPHHLTYFRSDEHCGS